MSDTSQIKPNKSFIDLVHDFAAGKLSDDSNAKKLDSVENLRLHLLDWGDSANKPLILLHGLASRCHMFDLIAPNLATRFHLYAPDQRGHGLSEKPANGYDFETIAADLDALRVNLGISQPCAIIGHSWGAYTALYYAATRPQNVEKIVLLDGGIRRIADRYPTWEEAQVAMSPPTYHNRSQTDIERRIRENWLGESFRPELLPLALSIFDTGNPADVRAHLSRENHMKIAHALWAFNPADFYPRVSCPALIVNAVPPGHIVAAEDAAYARQAETLIPHAKIVWMPDTIHDIPWHRPQELADILNEWL